MLIPIRYSYQGLTNRQPFQIALEIGDLLEDSQWVLFAMAVAEAFIQYFDYRHRHSLLLFWLLVFLPIYTWEISYF